MCTTCGCAGDGAVLRHWDGDAGHPGHEHPGHEHAGHEHAQRVAPADARTVMLQQRILIKNDEIAGRTRQRLRDRGVLMLNLMSSPGSGKTTLLERTARDQAGAMVLGVIEGDQETTLDADRIRASGCHVVQINTGAGCHLDAEMVRRGLAALDPPAGSVVIIENVGNLVCPALFDLGETARVVLACVTEGADKPAKYPQMFRRADLVLVTKTDLLPYVDFDTARFAGYVTGLAPRARVAEVSARTGTGLDGWYAWLAAIREAGVSGNSGGSCPAQSSTII